MESNGNVGSWKCGGCGTWYAYWVSKCECEAKVKVGDKHKAWNPFVEFPETPPPFDECENPSCSCAGMRQEKEVILPCICNGVTSRRDCPVHWSMIEKWSK